MDYCRKIMETLLDGLKSCCRFKASNNVISLPYKVKAQTSYYSLEFFRSLFEYGIFLFKSIILREVSFMDQSGPVPHIFIMLTFYLSVIFKTNEVSMEKGGIYEKRYY